MSEAVRDSRLELRVASEEKEIIERAAALSGSSMTDFIRSTMLAASGQAILTHRTLMLTGKGAEAFVEAITDPPEPNENLRIAARGARDIPGQAGV